MPKCEDCGLELHEGETHICEPPVLVVCEACGSEWNLAEGHLCYGLPPREHILTEKADRIIQLLEGDKAFAGRVLEQIYVEVCEVNRQLIRIHRSIDPAVEKGWQEYEASRGQSTTATGEFLHYPLMGDPPLAGPPPEVVILNHGVATFGPDKETYQAGGADTPHAYIPGSCYLCGLPVSALCHQRFELEKKDEPAEPPEVVRVPVPGGGRFPAAYTWIPRPVQELQNHLARVLHILIAEFSYDADAWDGVRSYQDVVNQGLELLPEELREEVKKGTKSNG